MRADAASWPAIEFTDERLANGLRLIMSVDRLAPVVAVNLWYDVGSKHEVPGKTGLAHLFEHMMFEGSRNVPKGEHMRLIESAGGRLNATTWLHRTNYFESAPSNHLETMLWLEADRMGGLLDALGQETLDNQRDVVREERRLSYDNQPYGSWMERMLTAVFPPEHPYHHTTIGSMDDLAALTLDDVRDFFRTYYAPNNAVLSIAGDFEPERAREWVELYFGPIPANPAIPPAPPVALPLGIGGEVRKVIGDRVPLERVYTGFRAPPDGSAGHDALTMATAVLSEGKGSRLYRRLVRERRIAHEALISNWGFAGVSLAVGWVTARPGVPIADLEQAVGEILSGLATGEPTDDEMLRARAAVERSVSGHLMQVAERADWLSEHAIVFGDPARANERLPALLAVTPADIRAVAAEVFRPDNRVSLVFVPEAT